MLSGCANKYSDEQVNQLIQQEKEKNGSEITKLQDQINELKQNTNTEPVKISTSTEPAQIDYSGWQEYKNDCFSFKYPSDWNLWVDNKCSGVSIIKKGSELNRENIQFTNDKYIKISSLESGQYEKLVNENYTSYYYLNTTPAGPEPVIYLVKDKNVILANYSIYTSSATTAELTLKKIITTFKFLK